MAKKKKRAPDVDETTKLPAFTGFNSLAGLKDFKAKIQASEEAQQTKAPVTPPKQAPPKQAPPKPSSANTSRGAPVDDDAELTFARMMGGVTPLDAGPKRVAVANAAREVAAERPSPRDAQQRAQASADEAREHLHRLVDDAARFEVSDDGNHVEGYRIDAPPNLVRSLRRGMLPIDAKLDLHGLRTDEAQDSLLEFLKKMRTRGERCVLVIHGKGEHSASPGGVLRGEIAAWLSQGRAREHVAAFSTAPSEHGGTGAVLVALRRG